MIKPETFWNKISSKYDNQIKKYEQTYLKTIKKTKLYLDKDDIVLDYACGTGIIIAEISNSVKEVHAIDISAKMIDIAKTKTTAKNIKNVKFAVTDIFDERYSKESFDVIFAFNILYFLKDTEKTLKRINELLKPEGLFISATDCLGEKKTLFSLLQSLLSKTGLLPFMKMFKISELKDTITAGNFKILESENLYTIPPNYFIVAQKQA